MFQTLNNNSTLQTVDEKNQQSRSFVPDSFVQDSRIKPTNLRRHKNSDFDTFLLKHANGTPNSVPVHFPADEKGRLK